MIEWYYRDKQSYEVGPLTAAEFEVCVVVGEIRPETRVWRSGLAEWMTYAALLAEEGAAASCGQRSREAARAPQSTTYRTQIALGMSPIHRRPARARLTTSGCTPYGVAEPLWEHAAEQCARRECDPSERILERPGAEAIWLGRQFVRIALAGTAFVLVHFFWMGRAAPRVALPPQAKAEPTVILGPLPTLSANTAVTLAPPGELALP